MRRPRDSRRAIAIPALPAAIGSCTALVLILGLTGIVFRDGKADGSSPEGPEAVVLPAGVRASLNELFLRHNAHWDELADMNTLERMLGTTGPTQREYMGCLQGWSARDTLWIGGWTEAQGLKQLPFGVDGSCRHVEDFIGVWHTHPYRADLQGLALKERALSALDLSTLAAGQDVFALVVWDVDSLDAAIRRPDGRVIHPVPILVR